MITLAKVSIRRPKAALAVWIAVATALSLIGLGVASTLSPSITVVPGTQSSRAQQLGDAHFGPTQLVPILLEGPKTQLDAQGPRLVLALTKRPYTRVLSAWDAGTASAGLRPKPTAAMIVVSVDRAEKDVVKYDQRQIESLVSREIAAPVRSYITGQPSIDRAERDASLSNLRGDELIASGVLFLLLLAGLRAPVAAVLVTAVGAISMLSGFGEVALLGRVLQLDPVGVAAGTMTGLALGVGFALLILDRFHREEVPEGGHPRDAGTAALRELETTGKAVLVAGTAMIVALALVAVIGPTQLMVSVGTGALTCAAFATGGAVVVMPAALVLLGRRIDAFRFPAPAPFARAWSTLADGGNWVTRHAVFAGAAATALLAAIAFPAFALKSGPPDISQLPPGSKARIAFEEVSRVMGPGWATPYNLIVVSRNGPITTPARLASLDQFERQIAKNTTVYSVVGPGAIDSTSEQLKTFGPQLQHSMALSKQSKTDLLTLINGLGAAGTGATQLQAGLAKASSGAGKLHNGSGQAQTGSAQLHAGLVQAMAGSTQITRFLNQALGGAQQLQTGAGQLHAGLGQAVSGAKQAQGGIGELLTGSQQITNGLGQAAPQVQNGLPAVGQMASLAATASTQVAGLKGQADGAAGAIDGALGQLRGLTGDKAQAAIGALTQARNSLGALTNGLQAAAGSTSGVAGLAAAVYSQVQKLSPGLNALRAGAKQLTDGIQALRTGNGQLSMGLGQLYTGAGQLSSGQGQLASGLGQLSGGGSQLTSGLGQLTAGASALQTGLAQLTSGTGQLASGLAGGVGPAGRLITGLGMMQAGVVKSRGQIPSTKQLEQLFRESPGMFNSGYFVLAAVEGAQPSDRNAATFSVNVGQGGDAGQTVVVSKYRASDSRTIALGKQLVAMTKSFAADPAARSTTPGWQAAVGGPAGNLGDLTSATKSRIWLDVAVLTAAILLILGVALRAVLLPVVTIAFGLLSVAAAFGVLQLLLGGPNPPFAGPGYLDPITIIEIFAGAFGISVLYSTLLLMRTREANVAGRPRQDAVRIGLRETAAPATGAGLVMVAALVPFTATDLLNVRALGTGVAVAILLHVVIVRPVLLPATETVLGRYGWWPTSGPRPGRPRRTDEQPAPVSEEPPDRPDVEVNPPPSPRAPIGAPR